MKEVKRNIRERVYVIVGRSLCAPPPRELLSALTYAIRVGKKKQAQFHAKTALMLWGRKYILYVREGKNFYFPHSLRKNQQYNGGL